MVKLTKILDKNSVFREHHEIKKYYEIQNNLSLPKYYSQKIWPPFSRCRNMKTITLF